MNLAYASLLPTHFSPHSRVWIYQSSRLFSLEEALAVEELLNKFIKIWESHGAPVKGAALLLFGQFIILMADETRVGVGGCSTDSSVHMIKDLEQEFKVSLFDRSQLALVMHEKIQLLPLSQFSYALENGFIHPDTLYFDNTVANKEALETKWIIPVKESWLSRKLTHG